MFFKEFSRRYNIKKGKIIDSVPLQRVSLPHIPKLHKQGVLLVLIF